MRCSEQRGFTLIELLVVVAVIGMIVAIAIPNLLHAIDRGKQKRTMADLRTVGTALESYAVDLNYYPRYPGLQPVAGAVESHLQPFVKVVPIHDGWSRDLRYQSDAVGTDYTVLSYGRDAVRSAASTGATQDFDCDILFQNGAFVAWPEGIQT